jgi:nucleoid-associated protein YgaU
MGLFGKSFDEEVEEAIEQINNMNLGVRNLGATIDDKTVTLSGTAPSVEVSAQVMGTFNEMVDTDNTLNTIKVDKPPEPKPASAPEPEPEQPSQTIHVVQPGETLGHIALKYYGNANEYMKIFEANRNILDNPDVIKPGQELVIPK